jgi:hypothetical protein
LTATANVARGDLVDHRFAKLADRRGRDHTGLREKAMGKSVLEMQKRL